MSSWTILCCFVATKHLFSQSLSIVLRCGVSCGMSSCQVYSEARLCPDQTFLSLYLRRHVAALCMLYKVNSNSKHCLFSELPSASVSVQHTGAAAEDHPLEFEVSRCRAFQFARYFLPAQTRVWIDLPYTVIDTER